jgi:hypothetical protein
MTHPDAGTVEQPVTSEDTRSGPHVPARPRWRRSWLVVVIVVVLVAGGIGAWLAVHRAGATDLGSASPQQAATKLLSDVGTGGLLGAVNDLPPTEATVLRAAISGPGAQAAGLSIHTSGITFSAVEQVNDHIAVTKLVAGTITTSAQVPAGDVLRTAFPGLIPAAGQGTVDVRRLGHPVRIVTTKVGGRWYPSVFYTVMDANLQALHAKWPTKAIPAIGADVPNEAVEDFIQAVVDPNITLAIEHTSSDEMAALHDAGQALVNTNSTRPRSGITVGPLTFDDVPVTGGVDVVLRSMTLTAHGQQTAVTRQGGCYTVRTGSAQDQLCAAGVAGTVHDDAVLKSVPPALVTLIDGMLSTSVLNGVGIFVTEAKEVWYVDLGRTFTQFIRNPAGSVTPQGLAAVLGMTQSQ